MMTNRKLGWVVTASGVVGLTAFCLLMYALLVHWNIEPGNQDIRFRAHDIAVALQFLLFAFFLKQSHASVNDDQEAIFRKKPGFGISMLLLAVVLLTLNFTKYVADVLYMTPQGLFGLWLISLNMRGEKFLSKGLRILGVVSGTGLFLVGLFPVLFAVLVDSIILSVPQPENYAPKPTIANMVIHLMLVFGTFIGVSTLPIWTLLLGRKLLREQS